MKNRPYCGGTSIPTQISELNTLKGGRKNREKSFPKHLITGIETSTPRLEDENFSTRLNFT